MMNLTKSAYNLESYSNFLMYGLKIIAFILPEIGPGQVNIILLKTYKNLFEICTKVPTYFI